MGFLDKAKDLGNKTVEESKKYAEITKLNMSVNSHQDHLKGLQTKIGAFVLENGLDGLEEKEEFQNLLGQAEEIKGKIRELQEQITVIKGVMNCTNCGAEIPKGGKFCLKCGTLAPALPADPGSEPEAVALMNHCPQCGVELEADAVFCPCCGTKLN